MTDGEEFRAVEFLGVAEMEVSETVEVVGTGGRPMGRWWVLIAAAALGVWILGPGGSRVDDDPAPGLPVPTVGPISTLPDSDQAIGGVDATSGESTEAGSPTDVVRWPAPPLDRDPYVVRIPGSDAVPGLEKLTIVYVNSAGDPTVVSFATGDVYRLDVAAIRVHETFAVEDGEVRSLEGANPGLPDATEAAVVFHTYRDVDPPGVGTIGDIQGRGRGPELCLSDRSCADPSQAQIGGVFGGVLVERFDATRHPAIAELLNTWDSDDRWIVSPSGFRVPTPIDFIWVLTRLPL